MIRTVCDRCGKLCGKDDDIFILAHAPSEAVALVPYKGSPTKPQGPRPAALVEFRRKVSDELIRTRYPAIPYSDPEQMTKAIESVHAGGSFRSYDVQGLAICKDCETALGKWIEEGRSDEDQSP